MTRTIDWLILLPVLAASACATTDAPRVPPPADPTGPPVSSYRVPADGPKGMVHVVSLGRETLPAATGQPRVYLHLRLAAVNGSDDQSWMLDPREQLLTDGQRTLPPAFSESSTGTPVVQLARATRGFLDLYYPVLTSSGPEPARVTLAWRLRRGEQMVALSTDFERGLEHSSGYAYYRPADEAHLATGMGSGSWWWSDYYFWHDDRGWWPYRQRDLYRRYPHHRQQWHAERERQSGPDQGGLATSARHDSPDSWRGVPRETPRRDFNADGTSGWRGSPPEQPSVSNNAVSDPPPSPSTSDNSGSSAGASSSSSSAGDGKSSWRGGSGP
jgi:hypothetical protein